MTESWTDKTVSLGNVETEEFDSELAHITVSENRITVEFKDVDDWKRIKREVGEETILTVVPWDEVEALEENVEHLYYPHIDIETAEEGEKRLYFTEDETELLQQCANTIQRFWNAHRQRGAKSRNAYSYEGGEDEEDTAAGEDGQPGEPDEVEIEDDTADEQDDDGSGGEDADETDDDASAEEQSAVEKVVDEFMGG